MNNTGTKQVSIVKQTAFWREKNGEYRACLKYSVPIFVEYIKCNVWRLAVRYDPYMVRRQTVNKHLPCRCWREANCRILATGTLHRHLPCVRKQALLIWRKKRFNVPPVTTRGVWCVPSATHVPRIHESIDKVFDIRLFTLFF